MGGSEYTLPERAEEIWFATMDGWLCRPGEDHHERFHRRLTIFAVGPTQALARAWDRYGREVLPSPADAAYVQELEISMRRQRDGQG